MKVLVCGATGCIGHAVVHALRARNHQVVEAARSLPEGARTLRLDFMQEQDPRDWAQALAARRIDAVVNCVGILMQGAGQTFERVHARGPGELFKGAALAGVRRVVQVSALGVRDDAGTHGMPYLLSKLQADDALAALPMESAIVRPSLVYGPGSASTALFATLASLPVIATLGRGRQQVQPIHVYEVAEAVVHLLERSGPLAPGEVFELGGPQSLTYRQMLAAYRQALGLGEVLWLPVPGPLMMLGAACAEWLPQKVFSRDTLRLLEHGSTTAANAATRLLGRAPTALQDGLAVTPPQPVLDVQVVLNPVMDRLLRLALACMWLATVPVALGWPQASGVLHLLQRCGSPGPAGVAVMLASCGLNLGLGAAVLLRPAPATYALQMAAVLGYTLTAAMNMPELTLDRGGSLVTSLPVLALLLALWCAHGRQGAQPVRGRPRDGAGAAMRARVQGVRP
jgi:uncharacterized protein YbjT (DUF2867 family)